MHVLLVEDAEPFVYIIRRTLREGVAVPVELSVARNGDEAIDFLRHRGRFANAVRPDLILLDWNLPLRHGREVLSEIKSDPDLQDIPVCILTTSEAPRDINEAYRLHANCFVARPHELDHHEEALRSIINFWGTVAQLPN